MTFSFVAACSALLLLAAVAVAAENKALTAGQPCQQGKMFGKHEGDAAGHSCWMSPDCGTCNLPPV
ncbi:MAG: hypothetical protein J0L97_07625 [Alphaproteobacteria bacterium]|nr:hypothetical protein [Alphaproteobacteria bacterium]